MPRGRLIFARQTKVKIKQESWGKGDLGSESHN